MKRQFFLQNIKIDFSPNPGVPGVRSMGQAVRHTVDTNPILTVDAKGKGVHRKLFFFYDFFLNTEVYVVCKKIHAEIFIIGLFVHSGAPLVEKY